MYTVPPPSVSESSGLSDTLDEETKGTAPQVANSSIPVQPNLAWTDARNITSVIVFVNRLWDATKNKELGSSTHLFSDKF